MTFSPKAKWFGLFGAAMVAWTLTVLFDLVPSVVSVLINHFAPAQDFSPPDPVQLRNWLTLYAFFGLPIAVPFVCIAGFFLWNRQERRGKHSPQDAWRSGAAVGLGLGAALSGLTLFNGLQMQADPQQSYESWNFGFQVVQDGMPTALGWLFQLFDVAATAATGGVAGLAAWYIATLVDGPAQLRA